MKLTGLRLQAPSDYWSEEEGDEEEDEYARLECRMSRRRPEDMGSTGSLSSTDQISSPESGSQWSDDGSFDFHTFIDLGVGSRAMDGDDVASIAELERRQRLTSSYQKSSDSADLGKWSRSAEADPNAECLSPTQQEIEQWVDGLGGEQALERFDPAQWSVEHDYVSEDVSSESSAE